MGRMLEIHITMTEMAAVKTISQNWKSLTEEMHKK